MCLTPSQNLGSKAESAMLQSNDDSSPSIEQKSLLLLLASACSYSIMGCFVKLANNVSGLSSNEIVLFRGIFQGTIVVTAMFFFTSNVKSKNSDQNSNDDDAEEGEGRREASKLHEQPSRVEPLFRHPFGSKDVYKIVIVRGMIGGLGFCLYFYTISVLPLGDAVTLLSLNPVITVVLASLFLHEKLTGAHILASLSSVVGSLFMSRPSILFGSDENDEATTNGHQVWQWGYLTGVLGACCGAGTFISVRMAGKQGVHTLNLLFSWCVFGLFFSTVILIIEGSFTWPSSTVTWLYILGSCVFGTTAHFLLNYAARLAPAGIASIIRSSGIIWSYLLEIIVFHQIPNAWTILGVSFIIASLAVIALEKGYEAQQPQKYEQLISIVDEDQDDDKDEEDHTSIQLQRVSTFIRGTDNSDGRHRHARSHSSSFHGSIEEIEALVAEDGQH